MFIIFTYYIDQAYKGIKDNQCVMPYLYYKKIDFRKNKIIQNDRNQPFYNLPLSL